MNALYDAWNRHKPNKPASFLISYAAILRERIPSYILELGIDTGDSLRMWAEAFPFAQVVGVDRKRPSKITIADRFEVLIAEQDDTETLIALGEKFSPFDLIVDDCSHQFAETHAAFLSLWPFLRVGGWYAIEDIAAFGGSNVEMVRRIVARQQMTIYRADHWRVENPDSPFAEVRVLPDLLLVRKAESGGGEFDGLLQVPDGAVPRVPADALVSVEDLQGPANNFEFVTPRLAVGGLITSLAGVLAAGITHVVNCHEVDEAAMFVGTGIQYLHAPTPDDGQPKGAEWFAPILAFCWGVEVSKVLIHCAGGVNRGPSAAYMVLVACGIFSGDGAEEAIKRARPQAVIRYRKDADRFLGGGLASPRQLHFQDYRVRVSTTACRR